ncbi:MAG: M42 family metallopeptidase [Bacilli bacterium]|nr:M42 family metallopeptidase [Bacilli bacterium]
MADLKLLKELSEINGVSSREKKVREYLKEKFLELGISKQDIIQDGLGSLAARIEGKADGPVIMLAGHMDEIGMIVTKITDEGYVKFQTIGGWWSQVMLAQEYTITTSAGKEFRAITGSKPPHLLSPEERNKNVEIDDMYLDIGVKDREEAEKLGIQIGDMITPAISFQPLANPKYLLGKAWDDRIGVAIFLEVMKRLQAEDHPNIVYGVGTVQEEVGLRGARTSGNLIDPDICFALDVTVAKDTPKTDNSLKLGEGPAILIYDSSLIGHLGLREKVVAIAKAEDIPFQLDYLKRGGTDAGAISLVHAGVPSLALCIPSRYIHSHTSIIHQDDYENAIKLLIAVIKQLDLKTVNQITYE